MKNRREAKLKVHIGTKTVVELPCTGTQIKWAQWGFKVLIPMKIDYGVRVLIHLARQNVGDYANASDIAKSQHVPEPYLARICAELNKAGMIESRRGKLGGYRLALPPFKISVANVVKSLDRSLAPVECLDDSVECSLSPACSQRELWRDIEKVLIRYLNQISIGELANKQELLEMVEGITFEPSSKLN